MGVLMIVYLIAIMPLCSCTHDLEAPAPSPTALGPQDAQRDPFTRTFGSAEYGNALERTLIEACFDGKLGSVDSCLRKGARINARYGGDARYFRDSRGGWPVSGHNWTALMAAVESDHFEIARMLLSRGADVRMHDGWGATPLYWLADKRTPQKQYDDMARELIEAGADVNAKTDVYIDGPSGETILHRAVGWGHVSMVKMLLDRGADPGAKTSEGDAPINYVVEGRGDQEIREQLLKAKGK